MPSFELSLLSTPTHPSLGYHRAPTWAPASIIIETNPSLHRSITFGIHICTDLFLNSLLYPVGLFLCLPQALSESLNTELCGWITFWKDIFPQPYNFHVIPHSPTWPVSYFHFFRNDCCSRTYMINSKVLGLLNFKKDTDKSELVFHTHKMR